MILKMSEDKNSDTPGVEIDFGNEIQNSQAVCDVMTLYCAPLLYSPNSTTEGMLGPLPESSEPLAHAFQTMQQKIKEQDSLDYLTWNSIVILIPQLMGLLRECMANHRWRDANEVIRVLSLEAKGSSFPIWKAGFEVMMSDLKGSSTLMLQLFKQLKLLCDIDAKELMVEYCTYLLNQGRWEELTQVFESTKVHHSRTLTEKTDIAEVQLKGYQGLCWYVEWLKVKHKFEREEDEEESFSFFKSSGTSKYAEEELMKVNADKARSAFKAILDDNGIMDVFIVKYTELLEYYDEIDEAVAVLTEYVSKQPTNPNSHRYLYWFYKRQKPNSDEMIVALQSYVKMIPSDKLAIELCGILKQKGESECVLVPVVFDYLDYSVRKDDVTGWKLLEDILIRVYESTDEQNKAAVKECWDIRSTWWPLYHFESLGKGRQSSDLLTCKAAVAVFLLGSENEFTKHVLEVNGESNAISKAKDLILNTVTPPKIEVDPPI